MLKLCAASDAVQAAMAVQAAGRWTAVAAPVEHCLPCRRGYSRQQGARSDRHARSKKQSACLPAAAVGAAAGGGAATPEPHQQQQEQQQQHATRAQQTAPLPAYNAWPVTAKVALRTGIYITLLGLLLLASPTKLFGLVFDARYAGLAWVAALPLLWCGACSAAAVPC